MQQISHLIDGQTVAGKSGNTTAVYNPATGEQTGTLDLASVEEVDHAVGRGSLPCPPGPWLMA